MIDHNRKFVIISIPKTGSLSLCFSLGFTEIPEPELYHISLDNLLQLNPEAVGYYRLSFVRNPWDRMLSLYNDFTLNRVYQYSAQKRFDKPLFHEFNDFNDFCIRVKDTYWINDTFLQSQYDMLSYHGANPTSAMNFIGRFENYQQDYDKLCVELSISNPLIKMNEGKKHGMKYTEAYSAEAKQAINKLYERDIDEFKYSF